MLSMIQDGQQGLLIAEQQSKQLEDSLNDLWKLKRTMLSLEKAGINLKGTDTIQEMLDEINQAPYASPFGDAKFAITSAFGARDESSWGGNGDHIGIDLVPLTGNGDIYHVADGIVESFETFDPVFGHHMWVNHGNFKTHYAHFPPGRCPG